MATCDVTIRLELGGTAVQGAVVIGKQVAADKNVGETVVVSQAIQSDTTDASGDATITFEQGTRGRLICWEAGLDIEFDVPQSASYNIAKETLP